MRKKHRTISRAIVIRKTKLAGASKPSQLEIAESGSGKIAINKKTTGSNSQATELLVERLFFLSAMAIIRKRITLAIAISIWILIIFTPSEA